MFGLDSSHVSRSFSLLLVLAASTACQRQLPVVDETPNGAGAAGRASMIGATRAASCKDKGPAQLVRPDRETSAVNELVAVGDGVVFLASDPHVPSSTHGDILYKLPASGSEEVLYAPDPPAYLGSLFATADTVFFATTLEQNDELFELPLSGGPPRSLQQFSEDERDDDMKIVGVDDAYVYLFRTVSPHGLRIARADGSRTELPYPSMATLAGFRQYQNSLYSMQYGNDGTRPIGIYQIDPSVAMPADVQIGTQTCAALQRWTLTADAVFCETADGIVSFDPRANAPVERTPVYKLPTDEGKDVDVEFSEADGDVVYFRASVDPDHHDRPIRRLDMRKHTVDAISCNRLATGWIVGTPSYVYWLEHRDLENGVSKDGIYRIAKP
jgi:hypothetical protein